MTRIYPAACDDDDVRYLESFVRIPDNAMVTTLLSVVTWVDPETGDASWDWFISSDDHLASSTIGILELTKLAMIKNSTAGIFNPPEIDDEDDD